MKLTELVKMNFVESIKLKEEFKEKLLPIIIVAGEMLAGSFDRGGKVLSCGNGGSASDATHFTAEMVGRFQLERDGLAAISLTSDIAVLTAVANDYGYQNLFARQVKALGREGDLLLAISTSGNSQNIIQAIHQAHQSRLRVIALTGGSGGTVATTLKPTDLEIRVPSTITARIQELHILIIHCLCDLVEHLLFGSKFEERKYA